MQNNNYDPREDSDLERSFDTQYRALGPDLPELTRHFQFNPRRNWEFDRAIVPFKIGIELEGIYPPKKKVVCHNCGAAVRARKKDGTLGAVVRYPGWHMRFNRFKSDIEKYNKAMAMGWLVFRFLHDDVHGDPFSMVETIRKAIMNRKHLIPAVFKLTERESEVLHYMAAGYTGPEIADMTSMTHATVRSHYQKLRDKLLCNTQASIVARAFCWGLIDLGNIPWKDEAPGLPPTWKDYLENAENGG